MYCFTVCFKSAKEGISSCCSERQDTGPIRSIDRRPDHIKKEDRNNIIRRAVAAEQKLKEFESKLRDAENKICHLIEANEELHSEMNWMKTNPIGFVNQNSPKSDSQLKEKEKEIEKLNRKMSELQRALDQAQTTEAVKDLKIVELQQQNDQYLMRITGLEEMCRNKTDDDSFVSVSPTFEQLTAVKPPNIGQNIARLELKEPVKSNMRTVSAVGHRCISPTRLPGQQMRASSLEQKNFRKNIFMVEIPKKTTHQILRAALQEDDDFESDIREILNTTITPIGHSSRQTSKSADSKKSIEYERRPPKLAFQ